MALAECYEMNAEQRRRLISRMSIVNTKTVRLCEHIKTNGEFCGSPALRGRNYCYFHLTHIGRRIRAERMREEMRTKAADALQQPAALELPLLEDADSIQLALMQVLDAILHNRIDAKRAGLVLYGLQTAAGNLANGADFSQQRGAAVVSGYDAFEEDYELDEELRADEGAEKAEREARIDGIAQVADRYAAEDASAAAEKAQQQKEEKRDEYAELDQEEKDQRVSHPCGLVSRFFCSVDGPLFYAQGGREPEVRVEREAPTQRWELGGIRKPPTRAVEQTLPASSRTAG